MDTASASMLCRDASVTSVLALCLTHVERELIRRFPNRHAFMKTPNTIDEKVSMTKKKPSANTEGFIPM
jgi:hypothetical protein